MKNELRELQRRGLFFEPVTENKMKIDYVLVPVTNFEYILPLEFILWFSEHLPGINNTRLHSLTKGVIKEE